MTHTMVRVCLANCLAKFDLVKLKTAALTNLLLELRSRLESLERDEDASTGYESWREIAVLEASQKHIGRTRRSCRGGVTGGIIVPLRVSTPCDN